MNPRNSYIDFKNWVLHILEEAENIEDIAFNKTIKKASRLPIPDTSGRYQDLMDSEINYVLDKLASSMGDFSKSGNFTNKTKPKNNNLNKKLNSYLTDLWEIWEKYFLRCGWDHYASHLINSDEFQRRLASLNYHYNKLFEKCNECKKTSVRIPSSTRISNELHLKNIGTSCSLSYASVCGYEGFVYASNKLVNEKVFENIYWHWKSPNIYRMQLMWIPFILCSGKFKRSDILKDILESMKTMYKEINLTSAILLLKSGLEANTDEIFEYFDHINTQSHWDLSTPYNDILDEFLSAYYTENKITDQYRLQDRSFEGRFWNEYVKNLFEEKTQENVNLFIKEKNILKFHKKNLNDWHSTFCFAQEIYVRELRFRLYKELQDQFSNIDYLNDEDFLDKIKSGDISTQIKNYQKQVSTIFNPTSFNYIKNEFLDEIFLPFIDCFLSNHMGFLNNRENFYQWQNNDEVRALFFKKTENLSPNINTKMISDQDWQYFISLLTTEINKKAAVFLSDRFLGEVHSMKRRFVKKFEKPLQDISMPLPEKYEIVTNARKFIKDMNLLLPKYRIMESIKIDIIPEIKQHLSLNDLKIKKNFIDCPEVVYIAGYDGICEDYLKPMLIEIRSNAEKALFNIKKYDQRYYEVNLNEGKNDYSGYLILSVTNNFIKNSNDAISDPVSTGIGLSNIQHYANYFQKDIRQGWAQDKTEHRKGFGFFILQVYFPLWEK